MELEITQVEVADRKQWFQTKQNNSPIHIN